MLQKTTIALLAALLFSGCRHADNSQDLRNQPAPPRTADYTLRLPEGWQQIAQQNSQTYASPIAFTPAQTKTVYYFANNGAAASAPSNEGYYRELLGTTADGKRVVQDFYQSSQTPQTTPFVLENDANIESFDSDVNNGRIVWFTRGGDVAKIGDFKQGASDDMILSLRRGKAVLAAKIADKGLTNYILDDNNQITAVVSEQNNAIRAIVFYPNGSAMFQGEIAADTKQFNATYCWNEAAQPIACDSIQDKLEAELQQTDSAIESAALD